MKSLPLLALLMLCGLSACEKIRNKISLPGEKPPTGAKVSFAGPLVTEIPEGAYDEFTAQPDKVVIIDFYADWCGPCRQLAPILDEIAAENGGTVLIGKVNIDQFRTLATREGVHGIPDVRIFRDGKKVDGFVGLPAASEVRRRIETHVKGLPAPVLETADAEPSKPKEPAIQPMTKDWLPPGIKRR